MTDASRLGRPLLIAGLALAVIVACSRPPPRFPHSAHLAGLACGKPGQPECVTCSTCHTPSGSDRKGRLPRVEECDGCHEPGRAAIERVLSARPDRPAGEIRIDHHLHLQMPEIRGQCVGCHSGVVTGEGPHLPPMKACFSCHEHEQQWRDGQCEPCHDPLSLRRTLPRTAVAHEGTFGRNHGREARAESRLCRACHDQADCDDCHDVTQGMSVEARRPENVDRSFAHRGDFTVRHALEAQADPARCVTCHAPADCDGCHVARGVSGNRTGGRSPHPTGWVGTGPGSEHGRAARRDIVLCAGCHEQGPATNCVACHKVGAPGGNPHPSGWKSNRRTAAQMCRYCHE